MTPGPDIMKLDMKEDSYMTDLNLLVIDMKIQLQMRDLLQE